MDGCVASSGGLTFERGALASGKRFEIDALEVWGVGGAEALARAAEAQGDARRATEKSIAKARRVDKAQFANNEFDKEMLLGKTFNTGADGRRR